MGKLLNSCSECVTPGRQVDLYGDDTDSNQVFDSMGVLGRAGGASLRQKSVYERLYQNANIKNGEIIDAEDNYEEGKFDAQMNSSFGYVRR